MGAVKSALEIFLKLQLWEDVVACYQSLGWYAKVRLFISLLNNLSLVIILIASVVVIATVVISFNVKTMT